MNNIAFKAPLVDFIMFLFKCISEENVVYMSFYNIELNIVNHKFIQMFQK